MDKKSIVNDLYQAALISVLAVGYSMLGKKILKMTQFSSVQFSSVLFHIYSGHTETITKIKNIRSIDLHINIECYSEWRKDQ